jgi:hypothetical protein
MGSMRVLVIGLILVSCTAPPARILPEPSTSAVPVPPLATPSAVPSPPPAAPVAPSFVLGDAAGAGILAFPAGDKIWSFDAEARQSTSVGERYGVTRPAPDGHGYHVQGASGPGSPGLWSYYDTRKGAARPMALPLFMHLNDVELSPDGRSVAYVGDGRRLFLSLDGGSLQPIGDGLELQEPSWSPDGSRLFVQKCHACGALGAVMTLVLWERESGQLVDFYKAPPSRRVSPIDQPMSSLFIQNFRIHSWSPDARYVVGWIFDAAGSGDDLRKDAQYGRQLLVFDVAARKAFDLGPVSVEDSFLTWGPPHQLAYVAGPGWGSWDAKTLRVWTPERGAVDAFPMGSIAYSPSWSDDGDLFFISGGRRGITPHSPAEWAVGSPPDSVGIAFRRSGEDVLRFVETSPPAPSAIRVAHDGKALLVLSKVAAGDPEIYYVDLGASTSTPLVRLDPLAGWTRPDLSAVAWSR